MSDEDLNLSSTPQAVNSSNCPNITIRMMGGTLKSSRSEEK